ncbi:MarR family transcriptional regulator [Rhodopseudomonas sp. BR0M22]|uniref:MarR family winged helix-turn-helix transcriptional regulator n=1 Tax=Rhodopseudomonas sp. BR0M22 TaxID=2269369 RepID=UPI0013DFA955|nr:MarR family transcriptional regulator [Rhodopseudomonas sp. BR0M22]NEW94711.1 MarR family transcriptional regulator [Rhodopseudomonas sp. BR0M22]
MKSPSTSSRTTRSADKQRLENQLCFALYSTLLGVNKVYRGLLREFDLTYPQYLVMLVLWEKDRVNVSEICEQLYLETTTLTPLLKRLEARGLISRRRSAEDERQVIVSLTEEGRALRQQLKHVPDCLGAAMGGSFDDIYELRDKLTKVRSKLFQTA